MYLEKKTFKTVIASTPLVSIDLLIKNTQGQYLLGYRSNRPAQGVWFVPGGRILKGESMDSAFARLCKTELAINCHRSDANFIGPYEHFYDDFVFGENVPTHYVVLGYEIECDLDLSGLPNEQHQHYAWFTSEEFLARADVHKHSKWYLDKNAG